MIKIVTLKKLASTDPITKEDRRSSFTNLDSLTKQKAEDLIYRLGFTAKDIAMRIKTAPSTKIVSKRLAELEISPIRLSKEDYDYIRSKHIDRLVNDESFDVDRLREDLLSGMTSPSEILQEYDIPHRHIKEILNAMIEDYSEISRKCSSMRAISAANAKSKKYKIARANPTMKLFLEDQSIRLSNSAEFLKDLRTKIEYSNTEIQKTFIREYSKYSKKTLKYPEDEIFSVVRFRLTNKNYLELKSENVIDFDKSILYRPMSVHEEDVLALIRENYDGKILINDRKVLNGKELDFYLPELALAIEVNPIFTHNSNLYRNNHNGWRHEDNYHFEKYRRCAEKEIELIQLQEYDLKKDRFERFVKPLIEMKLSNGRSKNKVFARQTKFKEISTREAKDFLIENHRDGYSSSLRKFCLSYNDEIIAVATVSKRSSRYHRISQDFELVRLAFKKDFTVVGGVSKLVANIFETIKEIETMVTYSDNDYGSGKGYLNARFKFVNETGPRLRYISTTDPANDRYSWMIAKGFDHARSQTVIVKDAIKKNLRIDNAEEYIETELSHRSDNGKGYDRMFTSGSKKWKITRNEVFKKCQ